MATAVLLLANTATPAQKATRTFFNVLLPTGADPWVYKHTDGTYYTTVTTGSDITLRRSATLSGLGGGEKRIIWSPPARGPDSQNLWAPELHYLHRKWYLYFAADDGRNENHRMFVLENDSPDPFQGRFTSKGMICAPRANRWAIDGTVLNLGDKLYFIWSGWEGAANDRQNLYIAPLANPYTLGGPRVEISRPTLPWETIGSPHVNEGPQVVVKGQTINLVYSAGGSWTDDYCLGLLTAGVGSDPLSPSSWKKQNRPAFRSGGDVFGPGHASFVTSPDGREDWIVFHAARFPGSGWTRSVRAQPFTWNSDGTPSFGDPAPPNTPIPLPGGEPPHDRYEAEHQKLAGTARSAKHSRASQGEKVGFLDSPESSVEFSVEVPQAGKYLLAVRFANGTAKGRTASHGISVNGVGSGSIEYPNSGWDNWSNAFRAVDLRMGTNAIRFSKQDGFAELDCLDLVPAK
ncbi:family 43 glycosylhydrolase [Limnoglobus roseus]|uniref:family 43 glycosylhydrolase n=1 Tax=Limnoglobus roseus TaxID=2598579 RepID=UPI001C49835A|nr:family 43 glycosylhydrolase [Limnoglobus roseus]